LTPDGRPLTAVGSLSVVTLIE